MSFIITDSTVSKDSKIWLVVRREWGKVRLGKEDFAYSTASKTLYSYNFAIFDVDTTTYFNNKLTNNVLADLYKFCNNDKYLLYIGKPR